MQDEDDDVSTSLLSLTSAAKRRVQFAYLREDEDKAEDDGLWSDTSDAEKDRHDERFDTDYGDDDSTVLEKMKKDDDTISEAEFPSYGDHGNDDDGDEVLSSKKCSDDNEVVGDGDPSAKKSSRPEDEGEKIVGDGDPSAEKSSCPEDEGKKIVGDRDPSAEKSSSLEDEEKNSW